MSEKLKILLITLSFSAIYCLFIYSAVLIGERVEEKLIEKIEQRILEKLTNP